MALFRYWLAASLWVTACGCTATRTNPTVRQQSPVEPSPLARSGSFAELPRAPGERVLRHPPATTPALPERQERPVIPAELPPTTTLTAVPARPLDPPLIAALRAYLDDKPEAAAEALGSFNRTNRELLAQLLPAGVTASRVNFATAGPTEIGALAARLETPLQSLSPRVPLSLTKALFCTKIDGFGRYRAVPDGSPLQPGELILVYAELRNVPSIVVNAGTPQEHYVTDLRRTLRLRDASGNAVPLLQADGEYGPARVERRPEETQSPIRDYYVEFRFAVPKKPGGYTVQVEIHDPTNGRQLSAVMPLRVGG